MLRGTASCSCPQYSATQVPLISAASHRSTRRGARQSFSSSAYSVSVPTLVKNSPVRPSATATKATQYVGSVVSDPACKYAVVVARFNDLVTKQLLDGALSSFKRHGVPEEHVEVAWVPGSFELPLVAKSMAMSGKYHASGGNWGGAELSSASAQLCLPQLHSSSVCAQQIQGATTHYDAVVSAATSGILNASLASGVPIVFGVLTTDSLEQALDRAGGKVGNKGGEAAETAVEMASLMLQLQEAGWVDVYKEKHYRTQLLDELYSEVKQATFKELRKLAKGLKLVIKLMKPISNAIHRLEADAPYLSQVLMVWNALVDHAKEWVEHAVIVSPRLALGVVAAFQRRAQTHYSPAYAAAYALDPANYKYLAPGTHPRPIMHRLQPTQQEDVVTVVARLAECSLGAARRELTLLTLGDWPTDMKSSVEAIVAETRTDEDGKTTTACISVRSGFWTFLGARCFTNLRLAAVRLLAMHVTTAAAERNWSSWGNTYNAGRSQLDVATAEKMVFIKANIPSSEPSEPSQLLAEGITI
ncbi:hypothetical protein QJQ45_028178 [Haematococcus lacustris]|nr:hypothetical protein QJQ45_028178 [Haematococcus lacustris]